MNIFIASSTAAKSQAKAFMTGCSRDGICFLPWWEQFLPGKTLLGELTRICKRIQRAIIVLSPESDTKLRGRKQPIPNLNILFEFGFFYSALGPDNVAVVRYGQVHLPSDLDGYIHITGSKGFSRSGAVKVGKQTKLEFERWLNPTKPQGPLSVDQVLAKLSAERTAQRVKAEQVIARLSAERAP